MNTRHHTSPGSRTIASRYDLQCLEGPTSYVGPPHFEQSRGNADILGDLSLLPFIPPLGFFPRLKANSEEVEVSLIGDRDQTQNINEGKFTYT